MKKHNWLYWVGIVAFLACAGYLAASPLGQKVVTVGGNAAYMNVYDEDDMSSDSATGLATQQSIKAYVDNGNVKDLTTTSDFTSGATTGKGDYAVTTSYNWYYIFNDDCVQSGVTLPSITSAIDGWKVGFKYIGSGTTKFYVYPASGVTNYIESTQGTFTATSDSSLDAAGDVRVWQARYINSGTTKVWYLILDER